jgi:DNA-binding NarL/FixJ family response regulator
MNTRILLADDHGMMRDGLKAVIAHQPGMEVVGEAENGKDTVTLAAKLRPHVVIMDIGMPDLNGIEATRRIVRDQPGMKTIALSIHADQRYVAEMLKAGACGYLLKRSAADELVRAIKAVMTGRTYLSPDVAGGVVEGFVRQPGTAKDDAEAFSELTDREREVLQILAEGKTTKEIAAALGVSVKTVETHRRNIMQKLDLHSVAELTKYAVRQGITAVE